MQKANNDDELKYPMGSLLIHRPISDLYFRIWYSLNPVTAQNGLVLNWCVNVAASGPEATSGSPKGA